MTITTSPPPMPPSNMKEPAPPFPPGGQRAGTRMRGAFRAAVLKDFRPHLPVAAAVPGLMLVTLFLIDMIRAMQPRTSQQGSGTDTDILATSALVPIVPIAAAFI